jgi:hypothetical protein
VVSQRSTKWLFPAVAVVLWLGLTYVVLEGAYSLLGGREMRTSLTYSIYENWFIPPKDLSADPFDASSRTIQDSLQLTSQFEDFKAHGVALGNSPFDELKSARVYINAEEDGCKVQKPNIRKTVSYLRSNLFNPFDQLTYFHDADEPLSPALQEFFSRFQFRQVSHSSNEYGERLTLPVVESDAKVLIAGDSVANGVMLDDDETLASQLQASDHDHQYVNLGISGAKTADIFCALEKAAERYSGEIRALIYVFCENDFLDGDRSRPADGVIDGIAAYQRRENIETIILVYSPYIYNVVPEVTRVRGHSHSDFPTHGAEKRRLLTLAREAGFAVVDYFDLATEEQETVASQFAPLALYVDHAHHSRYGVSRLVLALRPHLQKAVRR